MSDSVHGPDDRAEQVYSLYQRGSELLETGNFHAATIPARAGARLRARQDLDS